MHEPQFTAVVFSRLDRGEELFWSEVRMAHASPLGYQAIYYASPTENFQGLLHQLLDWSMRQGKEIAWDYQLAKETTMKGFVSTPPANPPTLASFLSKGLDAQQAADRALAQAQGPLNKQESQQLFNLEGIVQRGLDKFIEVGQALAAIRDSRLYRDKYGNFEDYVRERWGMSARHAHRLVDGAQIAQNLLPPAATELTNWSAPRNESQVRPLKGLEPTEQKEVWAEATKAAGPAPVTARHVEQARAQLHPKKDAWPKPNDFGVYDKKGSECKECFRKRLGFARLYVLQIGPDKWIGAREVCFETGNFEHTAEPLSSEEHTFPTREEAFLHLTDELLDRIKPYATSKNPTHPNQCFWARKMREWALELKVGLTNQQHFSLEMEAAPKPTAKGERLMLATEQLIKDVISLRCLAEESHKLAVRGALHLSLAVTNVKKFRDCLLQAQKAKETKSSKPAALKNLLADRWKAAKASARAVKPVVAAGADPVVIYREGLEGPAFFLTQNGGWTPHVEKAQQFQAGNRSQAETWPPRW